MLRREFLALAGAGFAVHAQDTPVQESMTSGPTYDHTPQIGVVRSDLRDGKEEDGTPFRGLARPRPVNMPLTEIEIGAMVRKAIGFGALRRGGLHTRIRADEWVLLLAGRDADIRVVRAVVGYLKEHRLGKRITISGGAAVPGCESLALETADRLDLPVPMHSTRSCSIPKIVQTCDRLITVASLASLAVGNYAGLAVHPVDVGGLADLYEFHHADYAVVSGTGEGRNIIFVGVNAVAADAIAAAAMGRPIDYLAAMRRRGFGETDPDAIWVRGNTLEEAASVFAGKES